MKTTDPKKDIKNHNIKRTFTLGELGNTGVVARE